MYVHFALNQNKSALFTFGDEFNVTLQMCRQLCTESISRPVALHLQEASSFRQGLLETSAELLACHPFGS